MSKKIRAVAAALAVAALAVTGCSAGGGDDDSPIRIGGVSSVTGPVPFPDIPAAAAAVFDRVNAEGGIDGRQIDYLSEDDAADPALASQAGRRLVDEENVVALAGSASMVDCSANAALYAQRGVVSIPGTGVDVACFNSANIAPVNTGPFESYTSLLYYASEELKAEKVCAIILGLPGLTEGYLASIDRWKEITGKDVAMTDTSVTFGDDPTPAILAAKSADCDAVVFNSTEPIATSFMGTVKQQGLLDEMQWLTITAAYTEAAISTLQDQNTLGLYVNSEFLPFTGDDPALDDWRKTLTDADVPLTSLSVGGYVSATILVDVLKSIEGPITRESVTEAFRNLDDLENPLLGMPFTFGEADVHNPNRASQIVQATDDGWAVVSDWIRLPE
ncbi:MAG: ABC transporter substrate-binding protein [Leucobacter sp.]